ncbi:MAG TPA: Flp pilus assembly complex ATPase component TadA [Rhodospirillaceae bacterium]|nr:Flp pilus assembly complex ATPase component TadA [Rhodospirillaceae bacterium]
MSAAAAELLTRQGGPIRTNEALRDKVAIFSDGRCLVSRSNAEDIDVISVIALAGRLGFATQAAEYVDLGSLRSLYSVSREHAVWPAVGRAARDDTAMQREVHELILRARRLEASDIHVVVDGNAVSVRLRVNGELMPLPGGTDGTPVHWQVEHGRQICMTAYAMAAEGGTADANYDPFGYQAGRIVSGLPEGIQAVRLQFNPVGYSGRHMVMRLLYAGHAVGRSLADLGFTATQEAMLGELTESQAGLVVISGPTGSGKTTTLERLMRTIVRRKPGESLLSVEDPPEYRIPGVVQLPVSNLRNDGDRGSAYADAIAAALRSDPDRIMIGEVRTPAAAHYAFEAAMTGHQVLTTLHANDALGIVPRFLDIGVEAYKLRDPSLIRGLLAQRLLKRLCPGCRRQVHPRDSRLAGDALARLLAVVGDGPVWLPGNGCDGCRGGYAGRTVIAELALPDQHLLDLLCAGDRQAAVDYWKSVLGGWSFADHAMDKLLQGIVDPQQIEYRVGRLAAP